MKKTFLLLAILLLAAGCAPKVSTEVQKNQGIAVGEPSPQGNQESVVPKDWKTYENSKYGFEFKYPAEKYLFSQVDSDKIIVNGTYKDTDYLKNLNSGVSNHSTGNDVWIAVSNFASLQKTVKEACASDQVDSPEDTSCYFRSLSQRSSSQEDFLGMGKAFKEHSFTNPYKDNFGSNGSVSFLTVSGRPAIEQVVWSMNGKSYSLTMQVFDSNNNLIKLRLNLATAISRGEALKLLDGSIFKAMTSSFKFTK